MEENKKDINKDEHLDNIEKSAEDVNQKFGIEIETDREKEKQSELDKINNEEFNLEIEIQKIEVRIDELEMSFEGKEDVSDEEFNEYNDLKDKLKTLNKKRKELRKEEKKEEPKTALDQVSPWIIFYGIIMTIICLPGISYQIWFDFANYLLDNFETLFNDLVEIEWLYYPVLALLIFIIPIALEFLSWILYVNLVKNKVNKRLFIGVWILQTLLSIAMIIYVSVNIF